MKHFKPLSHFLATAVVTLPLLSCGGGGGGGDDSFVGAAIVAISASPTEIDTGDRTLVSTEVIEVNEDGIALKFRFPTELNYVPASARLLVDNNDEDASPDVMTDVDDSTFLVFYLSENDFGSNGEGRLEFQLEAQDELSNQEIEVDADVDDPLIENDEEFDPENPEFGAEDSVIVDVTG